MVALEDAMASFSVYLRDIWSGVRGLLGLAEALKDEMESFSLYLRAIWGSV